VAPQIQCEKLLDLARQTATVEREDSSAGYFTSLFLVAR